MKQQSHIFMWLHENTEINEVPDGYVGFVYLITNLKTGRQYVGKKNFFSTKRVKVKGRANKRKIKSESTWRDYFGSNTEINDDVILLGKDSFNREILHFCRSKAEMSYLEIKEQIERKVLFTDKYYNNFIGCRIHGKHLKNYSPQ